MRSYSANWIPILFLGWTGRTVIERDILRLGGLLDRPEFSAVGLGEEGIDRMELAGKWKADCMEWAGAWNWSHGMGWHVEWSHRIWLTRGMIAWNGLERGIDHMEWAGTWKWSTGMGWHVEWSHGKGWHVELIAWKGLAREMINWINWSVWWKIRACVVPFTTKACSSTPLLWITWGFGQRWGRIDRMACSERPPERV